LPLICCRYLPSRPFLHSWISSTSFPDLSLLSPDTFL
jgi:hypothetical protein